MPALSKNKNLRIHGSTGSHQYLKYHDSSEAGNDSDADGEYGLVYDSGREAATAHPRGALQSIPVYVTGCLGLVIESAARIAGFVLAAVHLQKCPAVSFIGRSTGLYPLW